tara:strand:+ start:139 stop:636 length:498 start_codon:yes stop_codon:yes gene_type:complete
MGYETEEGLFSAAETGAPHLRERVFVLAYRNGQPRDLQQRRARPELNRVREQMANDLGVRTQTPTKRQHTAVKRTDYPGEEMGGRFFPPGPTDYAEWSRMLDKSYEIKPNICRVVDGIPERLHERLASLGNAVIPLVAAYAFINLAAAIAARSGFPNIFLEELYE